MSAEPPALVDRVHLQHADLESGPAGRGLELQAADPAALVLGDQGAVSGPRALEGRPGLYRFAFCTGCQEVRDFSNRKPAVA